MIDAVTLNCTEKIIPSLSLQPWNHVFATSKHGLSTLWLYVVRVKAFALPWIIHEYLLLDFLRIEEPSISVSLTELLRLLVSLYELP